MKQQLLIILATFFIIICIVCTVLINIQTEKNSIKNENSELEKYINKEIIGTDLATLISKAIDKNEKNGIQKDKNRLLY